MSSTLFVTLTKYLRKIIPARLKNAVRGYLDRKETARLNNLPPFATADLRSVITNELGINSGDSVFFHASFAALRMQEPVEHVVQLLLDIIGPKGNVLMPFYPLTASHEFLMKAETFDLRDPWTSMGALAMTFGAMEGVKKSIHPTKSVAVKGNARDFLIDAHHTSPLPFGEASPYFRLKTLAHSKIVGLGLRSEFLSFVHTAVDTTENYPIQPYHPDALEGTVIGYDGNAVKVLTYAHDLDMTAHEDIPRFLEETQCPTYKAITIKGRSFYSVDAAALYGHLKQCAEKGLTFFYPRSLNFRQPRRRP